MTIHPELKKFRTEDIIPTTPPEIRNPTSYASTANSTIKQIRTANSPYNNREEHWYL